MHKRNLTLQRDRNSRSGHVAFLIMLIINLCLVPFYDSAFAQESEGSSNYVEGCPANAFEITPELENLFGVQSAIHSQLFESSFSWCTGAMWELDDDFSESDIPDPWTPAVTYGETIGGDAFVAEIFDIVTIDWSQYDLGHDVEQFAQDTDYAFRVAGLRASTTNGEVEV